MNRKLIRPDLSDLKDQMTTPRSRLRKPVPPESTFAEAFYYKKQMENHTRMVIHLKDGEELRGTIEWYDRLAIKVHRQDGPNILLMKDAIKYMYKETDDLQPDAEG